MNKTLVSKERKQYLKRQKCKKYMIWFTQVAILVLFLAIWENLANKKIIDSFIMSSPSRIWNTFMNLNSNDLMMHLGIIIAIILWWSDFLSKVAEPYLVVLNSLPKVALRSYNNYMGRSRNTSNYSHGSSNFFNCNNIRKLKWIFKNR